MERVERTKNDQEKVDDDSNYSSSVDDETKSGRDESGLSQTYKGASSTTDARYDNDMENETKMSHLVSSVKTLALGAKGTSDSDLERKQETQEEDRLEGAVGGLGEEDLETGATVSKDEKALALYNCSNTEKPDDKGEEESLEEEEIKTCFSCGKKKRGMKKCGACRHATYCDVICQKADWRKGHKKSCGNYKRFMGNINVVEMIRYQIIHGPLEIRMSLEFIKHPMEELLMSSLPFLVRQKQFVLLEIVGRHPHFFRPGCIVQDVHGERTQILFYTGPLRLRIPSFPIPLPLEHFLTPGRFIWLVDPVWHHFLDGTVGIRINDPDEFELA